MKAMIIYYFLKRKSNQSYFAYRCYDCYHKRLVEKSPSLGSPSFNYLGYLSGFIWS